jgi:hypothetical protein
VTEDLITSYWNYNLDELKRFIGELISCALQIESFEENISKVVHLLNHLSHSFDRIFV